MNPAHTGAHPSPEDVDAILDPTGGAPEVVEHVNGCERCAGTRDGLVQVRALLREESQRAPKPPPDLQARISAALHAEQPLATGRAAGRVDPRPQASDSTSHSTSHSASESTSDSADRGRHTVVPLSRITPQAPRRRLTSRWLAAAAGIAVLGGSAAVAAQVMSVGGSGGGQGSVTALESAQESAQDSAGERGDAGAAAGGSAPSAVTVRGSDTDYSPAELDGQVALLLSEEVLTRAATDPADSAPADSAEPPTELEEALPGEDGSQPQASGLLADGDLSLADPVTLDGCLQGLDAVGAVPVTVDLARWQGADAAILVLREPQAGDLEVWVVARDCGPAEPGLLHFQRLAP